LRFEVFAGACVVASCCCGSFAKSIPSLQFRSNIPAGLE
jgi:hypothetical protein